MANPQVGLQNTQTFVQVHQSRLCRSKILYWFELRIFPFIWWLVLSGYFLFIAAILSTGIGFIMFGLVEIDADTPKFVLNDSRVGLGVALVVVSFPLAAHRHRTENRVRELNAVHRNEPDLVPPWYYFSERWQGYIMSRPPTLLMLLVMVAFALMFILIQVLTVVLALFNAGSLLR